MQTLTQPSILLKPFAEQGDKNTIPDVNTDASEPQRADFTNGYPAIVSLPPDQGGLPPERKDFNALGYLTTTYDFFYQAGGVFTFDPTISAAIGGYPLGARLWYTNPDGSTALLRSTIGNNTNNFLTDSSVIGPLGSGKPWVIEQFAGVALKLPILSFQWSDHMLNNISWLRADTFSWQSGDVYVVAYNHLADDIDSISSSTETIGSYTITYYKAADGHKIVLPDQEETVSNIYAESGVAWYFVLDTTNKRFKLPRTKYGFTGYRGNVGKYVPESLPNITGTMIAIASNDTENYPATGAFEGFDEIPRSGLNMWYGSAQSYSFDASRSSSAYQNNASVQERATQMYLYFYVGNYNESAIEQTAGITTEELNNKLDLDLVNITNASKETIVGWGIPDYDSGITVPISNSGTVYTPTKNGILKICHTQGDGQNYCNVYFGEDNTGIMIQRWDAATQFNTGIQYMDVPVLKGQTYYIETNAYNRYPTTFYQYIGG